MELANALGVDAVVAGQFAKLGGSYQLDLKVLAARDGLRLAGWSSSFKEEGQLLPELKKAGDALASQLRAQTSAPAAAVAPPPAPITLSTTEASTSTPSLRSKAWIPAAVGGAVLAAGIVMFAVGHGEYNTLAGGHDVPLATWNQYQTQGQALESAGVAGIATGAAGLALGSLFYFWPSHGAPVSASAGPGGMVLRGTFE
jgi:hypothetical protein